MSRLLVNSVATFGKLMRNVGTKNYSTGCPYTEKLILGFEMEQELEMPKLLSIGKFDVVSLNKETKVVKINKDLPNMKMKVMFNTKMSFISSNKEKDIWSDLKLLEKYYKLQKCGDVKFHSENDESLMKKMVEDDTIVVELDKGQSDNLVAVYQYDDSKKDFVLNDFNLMSKEDKCLEPSSFDDTSKKHIKEVFEELGMDTFEYELYSWNSDLSLAEINKFEEMKNFFTF